MSSNLHHNLSYSINLPKATVHSEEVMTAVNKTLTKYYHKAHYEDYLNCYNLHKSLFGAETCPAVMQSEKIILCEINASLWIKALNSAINNITKQTYPHYVILQKIINYLLNASSGENFGMVQEFLNRLLITHPPKPEMSEYYWQIMSEHFVTLSDEKTEEESLLFCLIELISCCLKNSAGCNGKKEQVPLLTESEFLCSNTVNSDSSELQSLERLENFNIILNKSPERKGNKKQIYFFDLPTSERIKRCLLAFNFVYDVLETDFMFWLQSKELKPSFADSQPLFARLLWQNQRDIGLLNKEVHKILDLYELVQSSNFGYRVTRLTEKFVTLLGEIIRCSDNVGRVKYPFVGTNSDNFFREVSVILHQRIVESERNPNENELVVNFKAPWLRLHLCSRLLSLITGYQCLPELTGVYDILEHIAHTENRSQKSVQTAEKRDNSTNSRLMKKLKRLKSVNTKLRNGKTLLHVASEENDVEKIKALLTFPELDVNAVDRGGWTALHAAALKGNVGSVQELLSFFPKDAQKSVNTRARGPDCVTPLMCAVLQGHANVCQMLLEHSGSVLLEDVNELNQTPLELSSSSEVTDILRHYKKNNVWTLHSHKDISVEPGLKETVLRLCVEMIQAYFCTYRIWDVYKTLKRSEKNAGESLTSSDVDSRWDYMRYHRDIKRSIYKLRRLIPSLENVEEFKGLNELYVRLLSFNKTC